jgi:hypothetical protein
MPAEATAPTQIEGSLALRGVRSSGEEPPKQTSRHLVSVFFGAQNALPLALPARPVGLDAALAGLCFRSDLTYVFVAERRAKDFHAHVAGDRPQLGLIRGKKVPLLDILEVAFETARREGGREVDTLRTIGPRRVRASLGKRMRSPGV